jgi:hypothetical protein
MLTCGCTGDVQWRIPIIFVYRVQIERKDPECARHRPGGRAFAGLESMESGPSDPPESASDKGWASQ